jgi:hypothetical protein
MSTIGSDIRHAGHQIAGAVARTSHTAAAHVRSPALAKLARAGYAAKGIVYLIVGVLAAKAAFAGGGQVSDSRAGLATVLGSGTWAWVLVAVIGLGLIGYALWNFARAILDVEAAGDDWKGYGKRAGYAISGAIHTLLGVWALRSSLVGRGGGGGGDGTRDLVGSILAWPGGTLLVGAIGVGIAGYGLYQLYRAWTVKLDENLDLSSVRSDAARTAIVRFGRGGLGARGVVFVIIGWFFVQAAARYDAAEAGGLGAALRALQSSGAWGWLVLGLVAVGLAAYGAYMLSKALYRRIEVG